MRRSGGASIEHSQVGLRPACTRSAGVNVWTQFVRAAIAGPFQGGVGTKKATPLGWLFHGVRGFRPGARARQSGSRLPDCRLLGRPGFATWRRWRNVAGNPVQPGIGAQSVIEPSQVAGDDIAGALEAGDVLAHGFQRDADFVGDLGVEALTMFLQALQDFDQGSPSREGRIGERRQRT